MSIVAAEVLNIFLIVKRWLGITIAFYWRGRNIYLSLFESETHRCCWFGYTINIY